MEDNEQYELTFVVSGVLNEDQTQKTIQQVRDAIEEYDGQIVDEDEWGPKRLAYQIDKKRSGYYTTIFFTGPGTAIQPIERTLEINDDILRYLTLRMDATMMRHYDKQKRKKVAALEEADDE